VWRDLEETFLLTSFSSSGTMDVLKRDIGEGEDAGCGLLLAVACSLVKRGGGREEEGTESIKFDLRTVFLPILPRQFK
jgi:hypothetical protein